MNRYDGIDCPVCKETFSKDDDVVVCPDCGTPYHRGCIKKAGECVFADNHGEGYRFEMPKIEPNNQNVSETTSDGCLICPACGHKNNDTMIYCEGCGGSLTAKKPEGGVKGNQYVNAPFIGVQVLRQEPVNPNEEIDGVSVKDLSTFIGENSHYFIPRFKEMKSGGGKHGRINLSALLFEYWYYIYRKMWGMAAISFLFSIGYAITGMVMYMEQMQILSISIDRDIFMPIYFVSYFLTMLFRIGLSVFANQVYMNRVLKKIKHLRTKHTIDDEYQSALVCTGNVSRTMLLIGGAIYVSIIFAVTTILTAGII